MLSEYFILQRSFIPGRVPLCMHNTGCPKDLKLLIEFLVRFQLKGVLFSGHPVYKIFLP